MEQGYVLQAILSYCLNMFCRLLKCAPVISRKDLVSPLMISMFCVLWIGGEVVPELGREAQEVMSMASIAVELRKTRKGNTQYMCNTTVAYSWRNLVCEGLSRHMARTRIAKAVGSTIARGIMKTRVQVMGEVIIILDTMHKMQMFSLKDLNVIQILNCNLCCAKFVNWAARPSSQNMDRGNRARSWSWSGYNRVSKFCLVLYKHSM